ncbi:hypothetical protein GJ744_011022 [Endocarpon pusillum]|uniref:Uncharacterized protein n=1 Tax=Endocarpon pusillum TaxID=364733 RepID=A0A8H7E3Q1_9EURO|nr:hypothetical protein GJ744_011022 [Endocarpon pusillum]
MSGLTTASEISGIVFGGMSGVVIVGSAIVFCCKCRSYARMLARIAEGRPHTADLEYAEEGLARHPEFQSPVRAIARGLEVANHQDAAQRVRALQANARRHAADSGRRTNDAASQTRSGNNIPPDRARPCRDGGSPGPSRSSSDNESPAQVRACRDNSPLGPSRQSHDDSSAGQPRPPSSQKGQGRPTTAGGGDLVTGQIALDAPAQTQLVRLGRAKSGGAVQVRSAGDVEMGPARSTQVQAGDKPQGQETRERRGTASTKGGKSASRGKHHQGPTRDREPRSRHWPEKQHFTSFTSGVSASGE